MSLLTITAMLFIITALLHIATLFRFGNSAATRPVAAYGIIYLILGVLIGLGTFSWMPTVALILTVIGGVGATTPLNANPELRAWTLSFIAVDVVIIALLIINRVAGIEELIARLYNWTKQYR